jgi:hypothetical protein
MKRPVMLVGTLACCFAGDAAAQRLEIECVNPATVATDGACELTAHSNEARELLVVQIRAGGAPAPEATVLFTVSYPGGSYTADDRSDSAGLAETVVAARPNVPLTVLAKATFGGMEATRTLRVLPVPSVGPLSLGLLYGDDQWWYEDRQLPDPLTLQIVGVDDSAECRQARVAFRATGGGTLSPDTSYGSWRDEERRCVVQSYWRLGKGVGEHHVHSRLVGDPSEYERFSARARGLPRLIVGLAIGREWQVDRVTESKTTIRITRQLEEGHSVAYDSVVTEQKFIEGDTDWPIRPTLGVDWAVWRSLERVRVSIAASALDPKSDWYLGFSLLQPVYGIQQESIPFDLHAVMQVSRRNRITNALDCHTALGTCETEKRTRPAGFGVMLTVDSSPLLGTLLGIFGS